METSDNVQARPPRGGAQIPQPTYRRLRAYAFDPSLSSQLENMDLNEVTFKVRWEDPYVYSETNRDWTGTLAAGPVGEYLEVVDYDPASESFYRPVDLNGHLLLAQDGLPPSEGNPQFHQQMVYAVAMTTIEHFERALGRKALWRPLSPNEPGYKDFDDGERGSAGNAIASAGAGTDVPDAGPALPASPSGATGGTASPVAGTTTPTAPTATTATTATAHTTSRPDKYVKRLRIYPHALRQGNAFYSPKKRALLFGYFTAPPEVAGRALPGGTVFTCLSHDVIAHETTHALLDGMNRRFVEPTQPDSLAFHEAFADIVALFQHFSFPEVVRGQITKTRGDLESQNLLGQLAQEVGVALGQYGALRDAIGEIDPETKKWRLQQPDPRKLQETIEPHARGAILVSAVFEAFLSIYKSRVADLFRIATGGSGVLTPGALHPDLVDRLAREASRVAEQVLGMCIRALDYCPPVDITFGDYLRGLITGDSDLVPDDDLGYRVAFVEAFRRRGIYPDGVRTLSVDSLRWPRATSDVAQFFVSLRTELRKFQDRMRYFRDRREVFTETLSIARALHDFLATGYTFDTFEPQTGLIFSPGRDLDPQLLADGVHLRRRNGMPNFAVDTLRPAVRVGPDGNTLNHLVISISQSCDVTSSRMKFRGGCTMILDLGSLELQYFVTKPLSVARWNAQKEYWNNVLSSSLRATYFGNPYGGDGVEPFALLHSSF